jgi:hypothetical protein
MWNLSSLFGQNGVRAVITPAFDKARSCPVEQRQTNPYRKRAVKRQKGLTGRHPILKLLISRILGKESGWREMIDGAHYAINAATESNRARQL